MHLRSTLIYDTFTLLFKSFSSCSSLRYEQCFLIRCFGVFASLTSSNSLLWIFISLASSHPLLWIILSDMILHLRQCLKLTLSICAFQWQPASLADTWHFRHSLKFEKSKGVVPFREETSQKRYSTFYFFLVQKVTHLFFRKMLLETYCTIKFGKWSGGGVEGIQMPKRLFASAVICKNNQQRILATDLVNLLFAVKCKCR